MLPPPSASPNLISLLCPTRGRSSQAVRLALSVLKTAAQPDRVEILFYVDADDPERATYVQQLEQHQPQLAPLKRCRLLIGEPIGVSKAWNELAARSQGDLLVMAADDQTYNDFGWDDRLDAEVEQFPDRIFCMWFNDGHWGDRLCTFPIVSRRWCLTLGYFTTGLFECLYDDLWIMDLAKRVGRLHYVADVMTEHLHWSYGKAAIDSTYEWKQVNAQGQIKPAVRRDMNLFGRTAPYRETDARRLAAVMHPPAALQPGLTGIGANSIFAGPAAARPVAQPSAGGDRSQPTVVTLCLPGESESRFRLSLRPAAFTQNLMLTAFRQGQFYCPAVSQVFRQVLQPGDSMIDVGAHIGYFSLMAAQLVGDRGAVFAVEMEAANSAQLRQNIDLNRATHLRAYQLAIGSVAQPAQFFVNLDNDGGHALWNVGQHPFNQKTRLTQPKQAVQMETLDRLLGHLPIHALKLLKLAVEGAEHEVLKGSLNLIQTHKIPYVLCRISSFGLAQMGSSAQALQSHMAAIGYAAFRLQDNSQPVPFQASEDDAAVFDLLFAIV